MTPVTPPAVPDGYVLVPQRHAENLLRGVLKFRKSSQRFGKPEDVNYLLSLFPSVSIQEGYLLDYVNVLGGSASWILPYARLRDSPPLEDVPKDIHVFDRHTIRGYRQDEDSEKPRSHASIDTSYTRALRSGSSSTRFL